LIWNSRICCFWWLCTCYPNSDWESRRTRKQGEIYAVSEYGDEWLLHHSILL